MLNQEVIAGTGIVWLDVMILLGWVLGTMLAGKLLQVSLNNTMKLKRFEEKPIFCVAVKAFVRPIPFVFLVLGLYIGFQSFALTGSVAEVTEDSFGVLITIAVAFFAYSLVDVLDFIIVRITEKTETKIDDMMAPVVRKSLRVVIIVMALVQIAQVLSDKPITAILTGLGVGGLAIALAAQETIKNFFGSLVIFADKPFELGERIKVGGHDGSIEEVGFRSTRIRTLEGHLVTVPNGELANMMIQNVAQRPFIKRVMNVTITYDTPPEKVQQALDILKELLDNHEGMNAELPPRVFFNDFNDCSLNILAIYWYHPPEYWKYLEHANGLNIELLKRYNEAGIEFAFPTQTLYVNGMEGALKENG